jgi:hypothetical protein
VWLLASVVIALPYPSPLVRGLGLARLLLASTMIGLFVGTIAMVSRARASMAAKRSPAGAELVALTLVIFDVAAAVVAFRPGPAAPLSAEAYSGVQLIIICTFTMIFAVEVVAWLLLRK